jgi:hypothetical protein
MFRRYFRHGALLRDRERIRALNAAELTPELVRKSLDNCFYVYFDDVMGAANKMRMGSCKTRRGFNIPSTMVLVDSKSGQVLNGADTGVRMVAPGGTKKDQEPEKPQPLAPELTAMSRDIQMSESDIL